MSEPRVSTDAVMTELQGRVRERLRMQLAERGAPDLADPVLFADVEALLRRAVETDGGAGLLLPELLGDPATWRINTAMHYRSHRGLGAASAVIFLKRRLLMPVLRWFFEYSRDNFERQRRVNYVLFACVQELALEIARLRAEAGLPERLNGVPDRAPRA
ncbi:MAG: hypothetical protein FJW14_17205 [Acidimicrobiia bacterium]|nr:hypothetical protein [Acidimicrobiia bacterium]